MPPQAPKPNYDFLNQQPDVKTGLQLPGFLKHSSGLSLVSLSVIAVILFLVIIFGGSGSSNKSELDLIARAEEIDRVSALATAQTQSQGTKDLSQTVQSVLLSQQSQLIAYLKTRGIQVDPTRQTSYKNSATDTKLTAASQAGILDQVYITYVQTNLTAYQNALQTVYKTAKTSERTIIINAYNGNKTILANL